jgi:hypothetical protein
LRNGFFPGEKEPGPFYRKRAAILIASLAFHGLFVYFLFQARMTVKILTVGSRVRDVFLAPPVPVTFPGRVEEYIRTAPSTGPVAPPGVKPASGTGAEAPKGGEPSSAGRGSAPGGQAPGRFPYHLDLTLGSRNREVGDGGLRINLSAIPDHAEAPPLVIDPGPRGIRPFARYAPPGIAGSGGGTGSGTGTGGKAGSGQRASVQFESPGYDISPWARKIIDLIQLHWTIPQASDILGKNEVRIAVMIEKDGTLSSFETETTTNLEIFNSAAVEALKLSLPLPSLPDDFPSPNLKAVFVFTYHD